MAEDAFERWRLGGRPEINISDAANYSRAVQDELIRGARVWSTRDIKTAFEKKFGTSEMIPTGMALVVKGENPSVGLTSEQFDAIRAVYDIGPTDVIMRIFHTTVSNQSGDHTEKARLVWLPTHSPIDQIIISQGLARKLDISGQEEEIKILDVEEDISVLNLDEHIR